MNNTLVWQPKDPKATRMWRFLRFVEEIHQQDFANYQDLHGWSIKNPALFWQSIQSFFHLTFDSPPKQILNDYQHMLEARWFEGATLNYAEKALSRKDDHPALISIMENGSRKMLTYRELYLAVSACAEGLKSLGIKSGDRVAAILPNVAYTVIAFLATASIGAIWSSCSPDFGVHAAADRLGQIEPKLLLISDGHQYHEKIHDDLEKAKQILKLIPSVEHLIVCPILHQSPDLASIPKAMLWDDFITPKEKLDFVSLPFSHPLYILFSSGTTGKPKCIIHGAGGVLLQHLKELGLHTDIGAHDNLFFYTTCGWMMWNWMVSILTLGGTLTLYEGSPLFPDALRLFQLIEEEKITVFGTSAKFISSVEKNNVSPRQKFQLGSLRCLLSTGSPLLPKNYDFVYQHIKEDIQLSSISGGTDIVSCFALGNPVLPVYRGELQCLGLGMDVKVFDEDGNPVEQQRGELVCTQPFPTMPLGFWNDPENRNYKNAYFERFPGVWAHGDYAEITRHHGLIIYGRSDAVLNPGGVRIGTAEIYRQVEKIPQVLDSVVIGQNWQDDVRIVLFVKLQPGLTLTDELSKTICQTIRNNASPRHVPAKILQVEDIPHTINNKVVELAVRQVVHGEEVKNTSSIANPEALLYFKNRKELQT
ncbi:acetoacetate--CoA ligase [Legionella londiniensis]|uniref:acetoacetate--CoA ligase n=1 Tax=Legionella londiniensis TaxID=45068 RepID=UPI00399D4ECF